MPIDIFEQFLKKSVNALRRQFSQIEMTCLGMGFSFELELPVIITEQCRQFFYPRSSTGNFAPLEALKSLRRIHKVIPGSDSHGGLLIWVDMIKDKAILNVAYDDSLVVTAAFNLNLLHHLHRLLAADFRPSD